MSDTFVKKTWLDRQSQYPTRRRITNVSTSEETIVDVVREEGTVTIAGHPFSASTMNDLENRIGDAVDTLEANFQDGVDSIYNACVDKGSTPASHSLADVIQAIENISGGGGGINIFGTPESDTPEGGRITTLFNPVTDCDAYKAFGDNEGWISAGSPTTIMFPHDDLIYTFTDNSSYRPAQIQFCSNFVTDNDKSALASEVIVLGYKNGEWVELGRGHSTTVNEIVTISLDINEYYSQFKFQVTANYRKNVGLKNVKCYGDRKDKGWDTLRYLQFTESF